MRNRHVARVCHACQAPLAREEDACWRCGTQVAQARPALYAAGNGAARPVIALAKAA